MTTAMNEAEKLAAALDSRVVRNWVHSTGTSPKATGFRHDAECQQASALLRRQAEQIKVLQLQLLAAANYVDALGGDSKSYRSALAATKEET